jgi:hypothetical protein
VGGRLGRLIGAFRSPDWGVRMVHDTSTPALHPSPVDLRTLLVHNSTGLAVWREIVVLCTIETGAMRPLLLFPDAVYRAARQSGPPRVDSHGAAATAEPTHPAHQRQSHGLLASSRATASVTTSAWSTVV